MQKEKKTEIIIKSMKILKKKEKRKTKEKQSLKKEKKKGQCPKTREILTRKLFFKKREKGKRAKTLFFC